MFCYMIHSTLWLYFELRVVTIVRLLPRCFLYRRRTPLLEVVMSVDGRANQWLVAKKDDTVLKCLIYYRGVPQPILYL